jgi:hypothetical protein
MLEESKKYALVSLMMLIFLNNLFCQINHGGIPLTYKMTIPDKDIYHISDLNYSEIQYIERQQVTNAHKNLLFAFNYDQDINYNNSGEWKRLNNRNVWIIKLKANEGYSIGLVFENFRLKEGERLYIYNSNEILGAYTQNNNSSNRVMTVRPIKGNEAIIEFSTPLSLSNAGTFTLTTISLGYKNIYSAEDPCNININCPEGMAWQNEKRAVVKLVIFGSNGTSLCSGTLINNTKNDAKPLLITANHCIENDYSAERSVFIFNYESRTCSLNYALNDNSINGGKVLSTRYENDYTLLELNSHPPISFYPYYAGWSLDSTTNLNNTAAIHHPEGKVKKITKSNEHPVTSTYVELGEPAYSQNAFWLIPKYSIGITENGSSGCALFDLNHQLVGTLTGGDNSNLSECTKDLNDSYQKFSYSYNVDPLIGLPMKEILNPDNLQITNLPGFDPFPSPFSGCDTLSNISNLETPSSIAYPNENDGYYAGYNADSIFMFAEKFENTDSTYIYGIELNVQRSGTIGNIAIQIYSGQNYPEKLEYEKLIPLSKLISYSINFIELYPFIAIKGNYYVAINLEYSTSDTFNLAMVKRDKENYNSAYLYHNSQWISFPEYTDWSASIDIKAMQCSSFENDSKKVTTPAVEVYPNPSHGYFYSKFDNNEIINLELFNIAGQKINIKFEKRNNIYPIDLINQPAGIYILKVYSKQNKPYIIKLIKI